MLSLYAWALRVCSVHVWALGQLASAAEGSQCTLLGIPGTRTLAAALSVHALPAPASYKHKYAYMGRCCVPSWTRHTVIKTTNCPCISVVSSSLTVVLTDSHGLLKATLSAPLINVFATPYVLSFLWPPRPVFVYSAPATALAASMLSLAGFALEDRTIIGPHHHGVFGWATSKHYAPIVVYLGAVPGVVGHQGFNTVLKYMTPLMVSLAVQFEPVVGPLIGWATGVAAAPGIFTWIGGVIVMVATAGATVATALRQKKEERLVKNKSMRLPLQGNFDEQGQGLAHHIDSSPAAAPAGVPAGPHGYHQISSSDHSDHSVLAVQGLHARPLHGSHDAQVQVDDAVGDDHAVKLRLLGDSTLSHRPPESGGFADAVAGVSAGQVLVHGVSSNDTSHVIDTCDSAGVKVDRLLPVHPGIAISGEVELAGQVVQQ